MNSRMLLTISILLLTFLPLTACQSPNKSAAAAEEPAKQEKTEAHQEGVITLSEEQIESSGIITTEVVAGTVKETVSIQGRVIPRSGLQATVVSPFPGRLLAADKFPIVGMTVGQGQLLGSVEQELSAAEVAATTEKRIDFESQIKQTEHEVAQKTKDLERAGALYDGGVIAPKQVQQAETDLRIAQARHEMASRARAHYDAMLSNSAPGLRRIRLTAPISGTITVVNAAPNQQVDSSKPLFEITDFQTLWVEAQVYEDYLAAMRRARTLVVTTRAAPGTTFTGRFISFTNFDQANKTQGVVFEVANHGQLLALGMNVEVRLPSDKIASGPLVPASAIIEEQGHSVVFVESKSGTFERREVKTGSRQGDDVIITEGLKVGEKVVTTGAQVLTGAGEAKEEGEAKKEEH